MKQIKLNSKKHPNLFILVDDQDYDLLNQWTWSIAVKPRNFYAKRYMPNSQGIQKRIFIHRFIMNAKKNQIVDHIDHNGLNNQRHNLRFATIKQSCSNKRSKINGTSKFLGVSLHTQKYKDKKYTKWLATIQINK